MLTSKQHELLTFIHARLEKDGVSPSFDEMKEALGLKSKSGIHRLVTGLVERGFLRRLAHRARALEVLRMPDDAALEREAKRTIAGGVSPGALTATRHNAPSAAEAGGRVSEAELISLNLMGRIAAGTPIEALRDEGNFIDVPAAMLGQGEHYALEVSGDSMVEAGILDGDTVVIRRCTSAENGTIVVALVDRNEATLKRYRRLGHRIALEPCNKDYEPRVLPESRIAIQGRLVGLIRKYH